MQCHGNYAATASGQCSARGALFILIVDGVDTDVFQFFLDEMAKHFPKRTVCAKF
jgi:hypothetical protein